MRYHFRGVHLTETKGHFEKRTEKNARQTQKDASHHLAAGKWIKIADA